VVVRWERCAATVADLGVLVMQRNPYRSLYDQHGFQAIAASEMDLGGVQVMNVISRREHLLPV